MLSRLTVERQLEFRIGRYANLLAHAVLDRERERDRLAAILWDHIERKDQVVLVADRGAAFVGKTLRRGPAQGYGFDVARF